MNVTDAYKWPRQRVIILTGSFLLMFCGALYVIAPSSETMQQMGYQIQAGFKRSAGAANYESLMSPPISRGVVMSERRLKMLAACRQSEKNRNMTFMAKMAETANLFHSEKLDILYCAIPKIGSSYWKRILVVIDRHLSTSPFQLSSTAIHHQMAEYKLSEKPVNVQEVALQTSLKFMFTRDPYIRLFSAFCDKLFMISHETYSIARSIKFPELPPKIMADMPKATVLALMNVTFQESLLYATRKKRSSIDIHFRPTSGICRTCDYKYDLIGKMESFNEDTEYILGFLNQSYVVQQVKDAADENDASIIRDVCTRTFVVLKRWPKDPDIVNVVLRRYWTVLQVRGLLSKNVTFPLSMDDITKGVELETMLKLSVEAFEKSGDKLSRSKQKDEFYLQAYRSVSLRTLRLLRTSLKEDCLVFDYKCSPENIFQGRRYGDEEQNVFSDDKFIYS